jgi:hypothetical protein
MTASAWSIPLGPVGRNGGLPRPGLEVVKQPLTAVKIATYGLCRVKEAQAPRAPSVAHALHHIMAAQRRRRRKAKWCCVRCHEASSLANLWQLRTDRPPRTRQAPYWVVRAVFKMST